MNNLSLFFNMAIGFVFAFAVLVIILAVGVLALTSNSKPHRRLTVREWIALTREYSTMNLVEHKILSVIRRLQRSLQHDETETATTLPEIRPIRREPIQAPSLIERTNIQAVMDEVQSRKIQRQLGISFLNLACQKILRGFQEDTPSVFDDESSKIAEKQLPMIVETPQPEELAKTWPSVIWKQMLWENRSAAVLRSLRPDAKQLPATLSQARGAVQVLEEYMMTLSDLQEGDHQLILAHICRNPWILKAWQDRGRSISLRMVGEGIARHVIVNYRAHLRRQAS